MCDVTISVIYVWSNVSMNLKFQWCDYKCDMCVMWLQVWFMCDVATSVIYGWCDYKCDLCVMWLQVWFMCDVTTSVIYGWCDYKCDLCMVQLKYELWYYVLNVTLISVFVTCFVSFTAFFSIFLETGSKKIYGSLSFDVENYFEKIGACTKRPLLMETFFE